MVLSAAELEAASTCKLINGDKAKILSLLHLRQNTDSFLIQCLADREIQTLIYVDENVSSKSAYRYNCAVVHNPHACVHLDAVNGHGWNEKKNQPYDPKLNLGKIFAQQHSNRKLDKSARSNHEKKQQQIDQLEETIRILQEENTKMKQNYLSRLTQLNSAIENFSDSNMKPNSQQVNQLQQKIQLLNSDLQSQTAAVRLLRDEKASLQTVINNLRVMSLSKNNTNVSDNKRTDQLEQQLNAMRLDLQRQNDLVSSLTEQNSNLLSAVMEPQARIHSQRVYSQSSRTNNEQQGCCIIM
ncbi:uncharacterized protein LOC130697469 [Daphnia carinata]|uniref:uncharacterized protein LOC130697469 n=1 Tax=Daphnia carinata TaxID=120202 RepID=UPI002580B413|nr:uncharacterized protein LOC130697469 [Daphnia carinata]